jgi:hypothetical protein
LGHYVFTSRRENKNSFSQRGSTRVSVHPILNWGTWVQLPILTIAGRCHRWLPGKSAPMRWGPAWPHRVKAILEHLCSFFVLEHPYLRTPLSALRLRAAQPFPMDRYLACYHDAWHPGPLSLVDSVLSLKLDVSTLETRIDHATPLSLVFAPAHATWIPSPRLPRQVGVVERRSYKKVFSDVYKLQTTQNLVATHP